MALKSIESLEQENSFPNKIYRTYFISGFDPRGSSHYKRMFQQDLKTKGFRLGKRTTNGFITRWRITTNDRYLSQKHSESTHELCFLHWDDIARENWPKSPFVMVLKCLEFAYWYFFRGGFSRVYQLCPGVAICGAYPSAFLLLSFCFSGGIASSITAVNFAPIQTIYLKSLIAFLTLFLSLLIFWRIANSLGIVWLARSILFTHRLGVSSDEDLRYRIIKFADQLLYLEENEPSYKVRIVGHSSGSFVLAMLAAEIHRRSNHNLCERLSLLTLGQNFANLSIHEKANSFRADLEELGRLPKINWLDITSREDMLCFAGVNPYESCGIPIPFAESYPRMKIIRILSLRNQASRENVFFNQFEIHFNYLRLNCHEVGFTGLLVNNF